ncbi:MAG TPA: hypothetical protein DCZ10_16025 [Pelotomaculum sp.]|nr:hypothetical protein [Pelotomaculum sp.]
MSLKDKDGFHPEARSEGRMARLNGKPLNINWFTGWLGESFEAGWREVDEDPEAPKADLITELQPLEEGYHA